MRRQLPTRRPAPPPRPPASGPGPSPARVETYISAGPQVAATCGCTLRGGEHLIEVQPADGSKWWHLCKPCWERLGHRWTTPHDDGPAVG